MGGRHDSKYDGRYITRKVRPCRYDAVQVQKSAAASHDNWSNAAHSEGSCPPGSPPYTALMDRQTDTDTQAEGQARQTPF